MRYAYTTHSIHCLTEIQSQRGILCFYLLNLATLVARVEVRGWQWGVKRREKWAGHSSLRECEQPTQSSTSVSFRNIKEAEPGEGLGASSPPTHTSSQVDSGGPCPGAGAATKGDNAVAPGTSPLCIYFDTDHIDI